MQELMDWGSQDLRESRRTLGRFAQGGKATKLGPVILPAAAKWPAVQFEPCGSRHSRGRDAFGQYFRWKVPPRPVQTKAVGLLMKK